MKNGKVDLLAYIAARYSAWSKDAENINTIANAAVPGVSFAVRIKGFFDLVHNTGKADIKWEIQALAKSQRDDVAGKKGQLLFKQDGEVYDADDIGNYGFGVLAVKAGFSSWFASAAGGIAQAGGDIMTRRGGSDPNRTVEQTAAEWGSGVSKGYGVFESLDEAPDLVPVGTGLAHGDNPLALDRSQFAQLTVDFIDLFR